MSRRIRLVIFDLDGTLIDAYQAVYESINFCLHAAGSPSISHEKIKRTVGWGDRHLLVTLLGETGIDKILRMYRQHHSQSLRRGSKLLPGALETLQALQEQGYLLAVASNRPTMFSRIVLRHLGIARYFKYVLCGDKVSRPKPYPDMLQQILRRFAVRPREALYVGDMTIDVEAGRRARVPTVAVTGGSSRRQELEMLSPLAVVRSVKNLLPLLAQLQEDKGEL